MLSYLKTHYTNNPLCLNYYPKIKNRILSGVNVLLHFYNIKTSYSRGNGGPIPYFYQKYYVFNYLDSNKT